MLEACTGMGIAGIPRNPREIRGNGYNNCGNTAGMEWDATGLPRSSTTGYRLTAVQVLQSYACIHLCKQNIKSIKISHWSSIAALINSCSKKMDRPKAEIQKLILNSPRISHQINKAKRDVWQSFETVLVDAVFIDGRTLEERRTQLSWQCWWTVVHSWI